MENDKIAESIGYMRAKLDSIDNRLTGINGTIIEHSKTLTRHEVIFGKIGVMLTIVIFVASTGINFFIDWFRTK